MSEPLELITSVEPNWLPPPTPKTCEHCRFWTYKKRDQYTYDYLSERDNKLEPRPCLHPALKAAHEWPFNREIARVHAGDGNGIETGGNFGCVHWEQPK